MSKIPDPIVEEGQHRWHEYQKLYQGEDFEDNPQLGGSGLAIAGENQNGR